jgi:F0F1-type ATP synthase membrane subunit c/vacuolar-type H+-ATPase subunit K
LKYSCIFCQNSSADESKSQGPLKPYLEFVEAEVIGVGLTVGVGATVDVGVGVGVGEGVGEGVGFTTATPLFQTNFFPDLMHV